MREKNRTHDERPDPREANGDGSTERLIEARETGRELLDAAERALSGDSEQFLRASRQQGGQ